LSNYKCFGIKIKVAAKADMTGMQRRAAAVGARLMRRLFGGWGLPRELKTLRDVFLGGSADALALFRCAANVET
jgi:hypothetical protein